MRDSEMNVSVSVMAQDSTPLVRSFTQDAGPLHLCAMPGHPDPGTPRALLTVLMITTAQLLHPDGRLGSTLDWPLEHLMACHRRIEQRLATLERVADFLEDSPRQALLALAACFDFFESSGAAHTADEEQSVFPRLRPLAGQFLDQLEGQHREAGRLYAALKEIAAELESKPAGPELMARYRNISTRLCELYRAHMAAEDRTLVEFGKQVLNDTDLRQISSEMKQRRGLRPSSQ